jgi:hypothetical protein
MQFRNSNAACLLDEAAPSAGTPCRRDRGGTRRHSRWHRRCRGASRSAGRSPGRDHRGETRLSRSEGRCTGTTANVGAHCEFRCSSITEALDHRDHRPAAIPYGIGEACVLPRAGRPFGEAAFGLLCRLLDVAGGTECGAPTAATISPRTSGSAPAAATVAMISSTSRLSAS